MQTRGACRHPSVGVAEAAGVGPEAATRVSGRARHSVGVASAVSGVMGGVVSVTSSHEAVLPDMAVGLGSVVASGGSGCGAVSAPAETIMDGSQEERSL